MQSYLPDRFPVILLVASTLLAHISKRFLVSVPSTVHNNVVWRDLEKIERAMGDDFAISDFFARHF